MSDVTNDNRLLDSDTRIASGGRNLTGIDRVAFAAWPLVLFANMILPIMFGSTVTEDHGRIGVGVATFIFLIAGWFLCYFRPSISRRLILGSGCFSISQFLPVLQIIAGCVALDVASKMGMAQSGGDGPGIDQITSEVGGFFVTFLVGSILLICASVIGVVLGLVLPQSWFDAVTRADSRDRSFRAN